MRNLRTLLILVSLVSGANQLIVASPALSQMDAKKQQAEALRSQIEEQGRALSMADEEFNEARIERQGIEAAAGAARAQVAVAATKWGEMKAQLARRVRLLYMHPGAALDAWLNQQSLADLARAQKFGSDVLIADTEMVTRTERARQEVLVHARRLDGLRDAARGKERELASRQADVSRALGNQRSLLRRVNGEIAELIEQEREREIAAARAAAAPRADPASAPDEATRPAIESDEKQAEATGPPPPVKSGAAKAVAVAAEQIGKPYEWAADGPDSFDCSGLTMYAWGAADVSLPHSSRAQYASLPHVSRDQLQPGDLVFYGDPIHHMGIYEGGGVMINAPETGEFVRRDSINRPDWAGAARP